MKILVIGLARGGKDTFCELLNDKFKVSFISSSKYMLDNIIYPTLKDKYGYNSPEECYEDRVNHRGDWFDLIEEYNEKDYSRLARNILEQNDIYCGMRCIKQFEASKHLFDLVVWVDAQDRLGITESTDSMTIPKSVADIVIYNNGTKEEFEEKVIKLGKTWFDRNDISIEDKRKEFAKKVWANWFKNGKKHDASVVDGFISYWNRLDGSKLKHEKEKTFQINRRLTMFSKKEEEIENQRKLNKYKNFLGKVNPLA